MIEESRGSREQAGRRKRRKKGIRLGEDLLLRTTGGFSVGNVREGIFLNHFLEVWCAQRFAHCELNCVAALW